MKDFEVQEKGQNAMDQLIGIVSTVIVVAVLVFVGISVIALTAVQTQDDTADITDANIKASLEAAQEEAADIVDLTVGYTPILVIAVIAGIALTALLGFLVISGGAGGRGSAF